MLIPSKVAGAIIGKGGATIKSLRDEVSLIINPTIIITIPSIKWKNFYIIFQFAAIINIPEARAPERVLKICVTR